MRTALRLLACNQRASAAAEMALSLPLLMILLFGSFELGNYFLSEHKVVKAVRDGARYAGRLPFTDYPGCTPTSDAEQEIKNVTRTGQVASGGEPRVWTWTNDSEIYVTASCETSGTYTGIYVTSTIGAPKVRVRARVPYTPLLAHLGFTDVTLNLNAQSEATVMGI